MALDNLQAVNLSSETDILALIRGSNNCKHRPPYILFDLRHHLDICQWCKKYSFWSDLFFLSIYTSTKI